MCLGARCVSVTVVAAEVLSHENKTRYGFNFTEALTAFSPHNVTRVKRFPHSKMRGLREGKVSVGGVLLQLSVLLCLGELTRPKFGVHVADTSFTSRVLEFTSRTCLRLTLFIFKCIYDIYFLLFYFAYNEFSPVVKVSCVA